jgi:hypothetical protein
MKKVMLMLHSFANVPKDSLRNVRQQQPAHISLCSSGVRGAKNIEDATS